MSRPTLMMLVDACGFDGKHLVPLWPRSQHTARHSEGSIVTSFAKKYSEVVLYNISTPSLSQRVICVEIV